mmetsp:Transcript_407/g.1071  ORF Transcript_407/g.1071 Transcript_407/m.1071 type:complete len:431 (+) Transcript_407:3-1295(+)
MYKVVPAAEGPDEVTALEVFEPPETLGYYICSGVLCFVFLLVAFRDTRNRAFQAAMRCFQRLRMGVLSAESLFRDTKLIKADTSNTMAEEWDRKQEHNKRKMRQSNVLHSRAMGKKNSSPTSPNMPRGLSRGLSRGLTRSLTRSGTRPLDASVAAKKEAIRHKLRQGTMESTGSNYGARMLRQGSRWSAARGHEAVAAAQKAYLKHSAGRSATRGFTQAWGDCDEEMGMQMTHLATRRADQVQIALRPIVTPLWRKRRHLKQKYGRDPLRHLASKGEGGVSPSAVAAHGRDRQWLRQQEANLQQAAPPLQQAPQMPGRPANDFVMAPQVREAWGEGSIYQASAAGHWASQASITGRHATMAAHSSQRRLKMKAQIADDHEHLAHDRKSRIVALTPGARKVQMAVPADQSAGRGGRSALRYGSTVQLTGHR